MSLQNRLDKMLNKGSVQATDEVTKKEYTVDTRYLNIITTKAKLPDHLSDEEDITYEFALVPFKETNYLPFQQLTAIYNKDGEVVKYSKNTLSNYIASSKMTKDLGKIRHDNLSHAVFQSGKELQDPINLYTQWYFQNVKDNIPQEDYAKYSIKTNETVLAQIYIIEDPINPENNGTLKLINLKKSLYDNILKKQEEENRKILKNDLKTLKSIEKDDSKKGEVEALLNEMENKTLNIFNLKDKVSFTLNIKLLNNGYRLDEAKDIYSNVSLNVLDAPVQVNALDIYSLTSLLEESKDKYVPQKLKTNLTNLGWSLDKIFEYKAFSDLYNHIKDEPLKLNIFNQINKYNFDNNLFTEENYKPKKSLIKNSYEAEPENDVTQHFNNTTPSAPRETAPVVDFDDLGEDIPF
jgi:hypothetical protein